MIFVSLAKRAIAESFNCIHKFHLTSKNIGKHQFPRGNIYFPEVNMDFSEVIF